MDHSVLCTVVAWYVYWYIDARISSKPLFQYIYQDNIYIKNIRSSTEQNIKYSVLFCCTVKKRENSIFVDISRAAPKKYCFSVSPLEHSYKSTQISNFFAPAGRRLDVYIDIIIIIKKTTKISSKSTFNIYIK